MAIDTINVTKSLVQEVSPGKFRIVINISGKDSGNEVVNYNFPIDHYDKAGKDVDDVKIRKVVKDLIDKYRREQAFSAKPGLAAAIDALQTDIRSDNGV